MSTMPLPQSRYCFYYVLNTTALKVSDCSFTEPNVDHSYLYSTTKAYDQFWNELIYNLEVRNKRQGVVSRASNGNQWVVKTWGMYSGGEEKKESKKQE